LVIFSKRYDKKTEALFSRGGSYQSNMHDILIEDFLTFFRAGK